ncbi:MAG: MFS transporter [Candidatus Cloacimonetes bacterium HGW-Cloacimonetes-3]|jgi:MFS family permease|nr:MAG: MFS transporter [Candidatus Cloacimonetes bacterium HGW-Cloacimonetes-3]
MFSKLKSLFVSLTIRNYRIFFMGQGVSLIGTWIQRTTMGWFVYRLTGSAFLLGLVSFLSMIPSVFISPFAGAWADRWNRHHIMIITQTAFFLETSVLAILVLTGVINKNVQYPILIMAMIQGVIEAIDAPIRQSFVMDLVAKRSMIPNAIATNSAMFNGARLIGPAVGGFLIIMFSEGVCFAINAISYIPVIISLFFIRISYPAIPKQSESTIKKIIAGWRYSWHSFPIRMLVSNLAVYTLFGMSYATLMPVFAKDILHGNSGTQGLLMSTAGIGALTGSMFLASRKNIRGMALRLIIVGLSFSMALVVFAFSVSLAFSMFLMLFIGFSMMMTMATTNTLIQSTVSDSMRGRVISLYTMSFNSMAPFGSLMVGIISSRLGARYALLICAGICFLWSLNSLRLVPQFTRGIMRMLVMSKNTDVYRIKPLPAELVRT